MNHLTNKPKDWWAPLRRGLVVDPEAKHYRRMKSAVWLFVYLLLHADRESGFLKRKLRTISLDTGIKARTVRGWLRLLKSSGYIETKNNGRCLVIHVKKWRGLGRKNNDRQSDQSEPLRVAKSCQSGDNPEETNCSELSHKSDIAAAPNDISIKRYLLKNDIEDKDITVSSLNSAGRFRPKDRVGQLALDLAQNLDDLKGLPLYVFYARKYPESFLRMTLGAVKEIPDGKIKNSRAALFNHLVQKYAKERS
jgi:hypothetical protein